MKYTWRFRENKNDWLLFIKLNDKTNISVWSKTKLGCIYQLFLNRKLSFFYINK